jgi:hypothetical protein
MNMNMTNLLAFATVPICEWAFCTVLSSTITLPELNQKVSRIASSPTNDQKKEK